MLNSDDEEIFYSSVAIEYIVPQGKEAVFLKWQYIRAVVPIIKRIHRASIAPLNISDPQQACVIRRFSILYTISVEFRFRLQCLMPAIFLLRDNSRSNLTNFRQRPIDNEHFLKSIFCIQKYRILKLEIICIFDR
ncbi:hypothetical protein B7486_26260 [cyanobacterium TDX16]|nr:hypothetical protein B7486_26260 [cyanobacterium TDX16]